MLTILGTLLTSVVSGGATGLLGVLLQRYFDFKSRAQDLEVLRLNHQHALALASIESERAARRAEADERIADRQAEAEEEAAYARAQAASYEHDKATYVAPASQARKGIVGALIVLGLALVDIIRGLMRPGMTAYLMAVTTTMYLTLQAQLAGYGVKIPVADLLALQLQIVSTILYCATTCVVWWFGARPPKRQGDR